ncbi:MAG: S41 family peptidase [Flavobacteriales bacterium]|jgi:carboxyl-terminal processing protease|nr:S41 family peptidase [Flavobacteriales bacterium]
MARISAFRPLLLAVALVAGLYIGRSTGPATDPGPLGLLSPRTPDPATKIARVLDLIDRQYVDTVEKNALVDDVLQDILQRLDPHSYYISAEELRAAQEPLEGSFDGIGVEFSIQRDTVVVVAAIEGGPSEALGIRPGDRILRADTMPLAGVGITNDGVMRSLRGPKDSQVTVDLLRPGRDGTFEVTITRGKIPIHSVAVALLDDDGTGYIKVIRFARNTHAEFVEAANDLRDKGMKHLVLDLRGNGGGYLNAAIDLADEFLPAGRTIVYTQGRNSPRKDIVATRRGGFEEIPLAVLIDETSASASEIIAGAVQDNDRGTILGRRSFGKGLVQEHVDLPDASAVRLTTARYYTPSGRSIQRPYGNGVDYHGDLEHRYAHSEMLSADSIRIDSSQVFHTRSGRTVYGGGGVMPDIFVPADTTEGSRFFTRLVFSGTLHQFAFDAVDRRRRELGRYGSPEEFVRRFEVDEALMRELLQRAAEEGVRPDEGDMERSAQAIALRLKAGMARNLWGNAGFYGTVLGSDSIYARAREALAAGSPDLAGTR